jgi:hypothetical protein
MINKLLFIVISYLLIPAYLITKGIKSIIEIAGYFFIPSNDIPKLHFSDFNPITLFKHWWSI